MRNITIGLVGEAPNDVNSMRNILLKKFTDIKYVNFLDNINGSLLDNNKTKRLLRIEYEIKKPDIVIFIRDLDALKTDRSKLTKRKEYFTNFNSVVDKKGLYLLHVYEIECLFFFDIGVFNDEYGCEVDFDEGQCPTSIIEPKEYLKKFATNYSEIHNANVFSKVDFDKMMRCNYFKLFIEKFAKTLDKLAIQ